MHTYKSGEIIMKKTTRLSIVVATLLAGNAFAAELAGGKLTGDIRVLYYGHEDAESDDKSQKAISPGATGVGINPAFAIEAAPGLSIEVGAGIAVPVNENKEGYGAYASLGRSGDIAYGNSNADASEMYATLTKANVAYDFGDGFVKAGYQEYNTPLSGSDDIRLVLDSFMAAIVGYEGIENLTLSVAQITQMAGKFDGGADHAEKYNSMSDQAFGTAGTDDKPLTAVSAVYENEEAGASGQLWYYTMAEPQAGLGDVTAYYVDVNKKFDNIDASMQYISSTIKDSVLSSLGAKVEVGLGDITFVGAYNSFSDSDATDSYAAPKYYAWGGYPEYAVADEKWAGDAKWDGGSSSKLALLYGGIDKLDASLTHVAFSDVATMVDIIVAYEVAESANLGFVHELVNLDDNTKQGDYTVTKLHASYHF